MPAPGIVLGDVGITRVIEWSGPLRTVRFIVPDSDEETWRRNEDWPAPDFWTPATRRPGINRSRSVFTPCTGMVFRRDGAAMTDESAVKELRLVVTAEDYDAALRFYRDVLGLTERAAFASDDGRVTILEAGRATLELTDPNHAAFIDDVEVGRRVAGHVRVAFQVDDSAATTEKLAAAGAEVIAEPTRTPWNSLNSRLEAPGALQLTLFTELGDTELGD